MELRTQIQLAETEQSRIVDVLERRGLGDLVRPLKLTSAMILGDLVECSQISPVCHPYYVAGNMLEFALADKLDHDETAAGLFAGIQHDACLRRSQQILQRVYVGPVRGKARSSDIKGAQGNEQKRLFEYAELDRRLHADLAADDRAPAVFDALDIAHDIKLNSRIRELTSELIRHHDDPTIAELYRACGAPVPYKMLFRPDDHLKHLFRSADRLWLLQGIETDIERDADADFTESRKSGRPPVAAEVLRRKRIESNINRFYEEYGLYAGAFGSDVADYGFLNGTLHTSPAALGVFNGLAARLRLSVVG